MASTNIPWGTGNSGGDIVVNYTGNKNGTVSVSSSVVNQSIDRSQEILVQGTTHPEAQAVISVTQIGLQRYGRAIPVIGWWHVQRLEGGIK